MLRLKHILVIEDDPEEADLIQLLVERCMADTKVDIVHQAETALMYIESRVPRLILLDLYLPSQAEGLELLARFKAYFKIYKLTPIPIVVLTHSTSDLDKISCYQLGANAYMIKPNSYQEWKNLCDVLKTYWFDTVTLPAQ
ncbi:MAG: response regulator [Stigonema ocellatum SAG 48.90 = DSM 106950]|nr:response regulator [Stigonema ocellatum SAG 48.90 = DSM 106950]